MATDIDTGLIDVRGPNVGVLQHDIVRDPLPEAVFDLVHARLVLLHLPERRRALERIWHALKPGGWLVLDEFDCTWLPVLATPDPGSARLFTRQTADRLVATGEVSARDLEEFLELIEDPDLAVSSYLMLTTSGRRPDERSAA